jgi:preprotein translocase subunit SecG
MGILGIVLLVFFLIIAVLLILLVLVQNEEGQGLGGIFAGGSGTAFGSRSGNILTRTTTILGALFLIISFSMALMSRDTTGRGVEEAGTRAAIDASSRMFDDDSGDNIADDTGFFDFDEEFDYLQLDGVDNGLESLELNN